MKNIFVSCIIVLFIGCSSRQYYTPKSSDFFENHNIVQYDGYIKNFNPYGATLDSNEIITKNGILKQSLPEGYLFLNLTDTIVIATNNKNSILLMGEQNETIEVNKNAVAASLKDELLSIVFSDNSIAIYNIKTKKYLYRSYQQHSFLNDIRIAAPLILDNIILFPTLDGKVVIVDRKTYKTIRTLNVDPNNQVNNVILLETLGNSLIVATQNKIISIENQKQISKEFFIQNYFIKDEYIYVAQLDGTIIKMDKNLNEIASKKFKFAKILALNVDSDDNIWALEFGGYLIKINRELTQSSIYKFSFEENEKIFSMNNKIYFDNKILYLNK